MNNTGNYNTGYYNTGNRNTGDYNTGNYNTGNYNTGNYNTGYYNTGYRNTGDYNTGYRNTGDYNTGDYNTVNYETGFFNNIQSKTVRVFNKDCLIDEWESADKPSFIYSVLLTEWISELEMSETEKRHNQTYKTTGGYLKTYTWEEAWQNAWKDREEDDLEKLKALPNFDVQVFKDITGIDIEEDLVEEMTMEQICKELGREVKIKK